jgi:hypothetical protein
VLFVGKGGVAEDAIRREVGPMGTRAAESSLPELEAAFCCGRRGQEIPDDVVRSEERKPVQKTKVRRAK